MYNYLLIVIGALTDTLTSVVLKENSGNKAGEVGRWQTGTDPLVQLSVPHIVSSGQGREKGL